MFVNAAPPNQTKTNQTSHTDGALSELLVFAENMRPFENIVLRLGLKIFLQNAS